MSPSKPGPTPTMYLSNAQIKQEALRNARDKAKSDKEEAIKLATQPLGFCLFIAIFILAAIIAPPLAIVLL